MTDTTRERFSAIPRYSATGYDSTTRCAEMTVDPEGAWMHEQDVRHALQAAKADALAFLENIEGTPWYEMDAEIERRIRELKGEK